MNRLGSLGLCASAASLGSRLRLTQHRLVRGRRAPSDGDSGRAAAPQADEWMRGAAAYASQHSIFHADSQRPPRRVMPAAAAQSEDEPMRLGDPLDDDDAEEPPVRPKMPRRELLKLKRQEKHERKYMLNLSFDHIPIEQQAVVMFPGQGTQHLRMGESTVDNPSSFRLFEEASAFVGYDLLQLCMRGPRSKLDQTVHTQMALFVCSMAAAEKLRASQPDVYERITEVAGIGVGEISALVMADVLCFGDALRLLKVRAEAMHDSCQLVSSGMMTVRVSALSRLDEALFEAREAARQAGESAVCGVAEFLSCGVKVLGGSLHCLASLQQNANRFKFQVLKRLPVGGAFHTKLMEPAEHAVAALLQDSREESRVAVNVPRLNVYSNLTGKVFSRHERKIRQCIAQQISRPVKWEQIMQLLYRLHRDYAFPTYYEVGPGTQLGSILYTVSKKAHANYRSFPC